MNVEQEREQELLEGLVNGNEDSFCELYSMYKNRLVGFAMKFVKSAELAEDVFQDAFVAVWENRRFVNPNQPFAPYIYTIIKNRILNLLAAMSKDERLKQYLYAHAVDYANDAENRLADQEYERLFQSALRTLTEQQRRVFVLSRVELKSHKEIAEELHISIYTVQQHISTSLKLIRLCLKNRVGAMANSLLMLF